MSFYHRPTGWEICPIIYPNQLFYISTQELAIPTIAERLVSGEKPTARVEAMGEFSSIAARWSSFGRR